MSTSAASTAPLDTPSASVTPFVTPTFPAVARPLGLDLAPACDVLGTPRRAVGGELQQWDVRCDDTSFTLDTFRGSSVERKLTAEGWLFKGLAQDAWAYCGTTVFMTIAFPDRTPRFNIAQRIATTECATLAREATPLEFTIVRPCAIVGAPVVNDTGTVWQISCGTERDRNARGSIGGALESQGWTRCGVAAATGIWTKDGIVSVVTESSLAPGDHPRLAQYPRLASPCS